MTTYEDGATTTESTVSAFAITGAIAFGKPVFTKTAKGVNIERKLIDLLTLCNKFYTKKHT